MFGRELKWLGEGSSSDVPMTLRGVNTRPQALPQYRSAAPQIAISTSFFASLVRHARRSPLHNLEL